MLVHVSGRPVGHAHTVMPGLPSLDRKRSFLHWYRIAVDLDADRRLAWYSASLVALREELDGSLEAMTHH